MILVIFPEAFFFGLEGKKNGGSNPKYPEREKSTSKKNVSNGRLDYFRKEVKEKMKS